MIGALKADLTESLVSRAVAGSIAVRFLEDGQTKMQTHDGSRKRHAAVAVAAIFLLALVATLIATQTNVLAQQQRHHLGEKFDRNHPWMNPNLSPDERAAMVLKEMTLDEKIDLLHGMGMPNWPQDVQNPSQNSATAEPALFSACRASAFPTFK